MKAFKKEIYWQCDLMAIKKSNVACVHRRIGEILANFTQVSDVAPGPLVHYVFWQQSIIMENEIHYQNRRAKNYGQWIVDDQY
jgi:hypothetical protein